MIHLKIHLAKNAQRISSLESYDQGIRRRLLELCYAAGEEKDSERLIALCLEINALLNKRKPVTQQPLKAAQTSRKAEPII